MSRIDQALRRAALEASSNTAETADQAPESAADAEAVALGDEPFPIELGARPRARAQPPAPVPPPPEPALPAAATALPETSESNDRRVFERIDNSLAEKVVVDENMTPVSREQYRRLAAVLHDAQATAGLRVVMIASAVPGEGKTLTAANLALTLSESYRCRVLLIDADLRKPALHHVFRLAAATGLIEGLEASGDIKLVVRQVSARLSVLPAGRPTSDPMAALTSERMRRLIEEAKEAFDWVILDTPPLVMLSDAHLLASMVDGAVLVVRANSTPHDLVKRAAEIIGKARITGVVLNQAATGTQPGYGHHYYSGYYLREQTDNSRT